MGLFSLGVSLRSQSICERDNVQGSNALHQNFTGLVSVNSISHWFDSVESVVIQWWWCRMNYKRPIDAFCFFFIQMIYNTLNIRCERTKVFFCFHLPITTSFSPLLIEKASENEHQVHVPIFPQNQLTKKKTIQSKTPYFTLTKQWWLLNNIIGRDFEIKSQFPSCSGCDPKKTFGTSQQETTVCFCHFFLSTKQVVIFFCTRGSPPSHPSPSSWPVLFDPAAVGGWVVGRGGVSWWSLAEEPLCLGLSRHENWICCTVGICGRRRDERCWVFQWHQRTQRICCCRRCRCLPVDTRWCTPWRSAAARRL